MKVILFLLWRSLVIIAKLCIPGGTRAIVAENVLMKYQLTVLSRKQKRTPKLTVFDKFLFGFWSLFNLQKKLTAFQHYYNEHRTPAGV